jgi:hypothetical protein
MSRDTLLLSCLTSRTLTSTETGGRRSQIFYEMRQFTGSQEGFCGSGWPRWAAAFYRNMRRVPITCAKRSDTSATKMSHLLPAGPETLSWPGPSKPRRRITPLFDIGENCVESPANGVFILGQPGLEQTQKTKSVVDTHRCVTP